MLRWILSTLWTVGWYALVCGGWVCWWRARSRAQELDRQLTVMAHSWRYATRKETTHV